MKSKIYNVLKALKSVFLNTALWNISFPFILGLLLNYKASDSRILVIYLVWIPILSLPYIITKIRIFILLVWVPSLAFGLIDLTNWLLTKKPVSTYSLFIFFETNAREALSFLDLKFSYLYLLLPIYLFVSFYLLFKEFKNKPSFKLVPTLVIVLASIIFLSENYINGRFIRKASPFVIGAVKEFSEEITAYKKLAENIESFIDKIDAKSLDLENEQITVLIIGESTNRNRMSLYGYDRKTSPLLENRNDISVYTNVISAYTHTLLSVRTSLTSSNIENGISNTNSPSIIEVARAADFQTFWLSNQGALGMYDNLVALMARTSNEVVFVNEVLESNKLLHTSTYDEKLFDPFEKTLQKNAKKKLIIIHLLGTHASYNNRYPEKFNLFNTDIEDEKLKIIAEYDNAILYNDFVVNSIIESLKKHSEKNNSLANLIYLSDHGDGVHDDGIEEIGHDWWGIPSRHLVEIPFIVWQSESYKNKFIKTDSIISNNIDSSFCTDNIFHTALDLMQIETNLLIDTLSIFNPKFKAKKERIILEGLSYENEILKGKLLEK